MKRVAVIQARMGSSRLPGKILADLAGRPMLAQEIARLRRATRLDDIVIATSDLAADDEVVRLADREGVRWFRGSETDVLARYAGAAREAGAELVIRVTADCPLIDAAVVDDVVAEAERLVRTVDYVSNVLVRTFPRGLDAEALFADVLHRLDRIAADEADREHVTRFVLTHPAMFATSAVTDAVDNADLRWTVDTPADLAAIRRIYDDLDMSEQYVRYAAVLSHVRRHPEITAMNADVVQR